MWLQPPAECLTNTPIFVVGYFRLVYNILKWHSPLPSQFPFFNLLNYLGFKPNSILSLYSELIQFLRSPYNLFDAVSRDAFYLFGRPIGLHFILAIQPVKSSSTLGVNPDNNKNIDLV